jgi:hypothetical protein
VPEDPEVFVQVGLPVGKGFRVTTLAGSFTMVWAMVDLLILGLDGLIRLSCGLNLGSRFVISFSAVL